MDQWFGVELFTADSPDAAGCFLAQSPGCSLQPIGSSSRSSWDPEAFYAQQTGSTNVNHI